MVKMETKADILRRDGLARLLWIGEQDGFGAYSVAWHLKSAELKALKKYGITESTKMNEIPGIAKSL